MASLLALIKKIIIYLIHIYQCKISPILGHRCRFEVTCSQYGINTIRKFGILKGVWKTCIRILQCHPLAISNKKNFFKLKHFKIKDLLNMDSQRNFFIIAFLIVSFILWQIWDTENTQKSDISYTKGKDQNFSTYDKKTPKILNNHLQNKYIKNCDDFITVKTDVFLLKINLYGGNIEEAFLIKYLENLNSKKPLHLLHIAKEFQYQAHSGFINTNSVNNSTQNNPIIYTNTSNKNEYILPNNANELQLNLNYKDQNGITYIKRYIFNRNSYSIRVHYIINNMSSQAINIQLFGNLIQTEDSSLLYNKNNNEDKFPLYSYRGAVYSTDKEKYQKYSFKDIQHADLYVHTAKGWIAMLQKYFVTAWLPIIPNNNVFYTSYINNRDVFIGFKSDSIHIPVRKTVELKSILWIGPKIQEKMKLAAPNLDLVIDYGWLWFISQPLFKLLQFIYTYIGNWGISIILITLIIRLIMYPLTKAQYTSIAKIRMLQPKLTLIQEEYKNDKYQYHQKIIELYKEKKVNPLGGCLPLLIQMPIFLALYYMLSGSVELRHAKFVFWINDLSSQDPYYILPIIMGITMFFIQKLSPTTITDPIQKKIMTAMLIAFTIFFLWFPSGLVLYYIISNIITIAQQQIIYHGLSKKGLHNKKNII